MAVNCLSGDTSLMQRTLHLDLRLHLHDWLFVGVIKVGGGAGLVRFWVVILSLLFDFEMGLGGGVSFCLLAVGF